ncbi:MAG: hypothetical protein PHV48_05180 [Candidatus Omnitrophica bacterium]|nr:hypothetical protein [Candidatus Omnitrophota bacterium]
MANKTIPCKIKTIPNMLKLSLCHWAVHCKFDGKVKKGKTQIIALILSFTNKLNILTKIKAAVPCKAALKGMRTLGSGKIKK